MKAQNGQQPEEEEIAPIYEEMQPDLETLLAPVPEPAPGIKQANGKLKNKTALISGGERGIGRAVALLFAQEGANIAIVYQGEEQDALETAAEIKKKGQKVILFPGDITDEAFCKQVIKGTIEQFNRLDILVNNESIRFLQAQPELITANQLIRTFSVTVFGTFYLTLAALPYLQEGSSIINTTSVTAYSGSAELIDYSAAKGAIVSFTRSLSAALAERNIRVNAVAPGHIQTTVITDSISAAQVAKSRKNVPLNRLGTVDEAATSYLFLASEDAGYMTGQVLHPNGGIILNG